MNIMEQGILGIIGTLIVVSSMFVIHFLNKYDAKYKAHIETVQKLMVNVVRKDELKEKLEDTLRPFEMGLAALQSNISDIKTTLDKILIYQVKTHD